MASRSQRLLRQRPQSEAAFGARLYEAYSLRREMLKRGTRLSLRITPRS